ncbi:MAG: glycosyltransferase family 2 protein [Tannerellaceae bacterium]|jgi:hypothetical protein|nr:glycosyltransferase family 2 protein [Tannerellaceae bacterium]
MRGIQVITPVKDSIDLTLGTVRAVLKSEGVHNISYTIYNDFSTVENTLRLEQASVEYGFDLINLSKLTTQPSPNYLLILQEAQRAALTRKEALCIVESDVVVQPDTISRLFEETQLRQDCGLAAAVTVDDQGMVNYPYLYARRLEKEPCATKKHLSFCCTLMTEKFLQCYDFGQLDAGKSWHDVTISRQSLRLGFQNYLFPNLPVWHRPHGSRPWKQLKYTHPVKYYFLKMVRQRDKI